MMTAVNHSQLMHACSQSHPRMQQAEPSSPHFLVLPTSTLEPLEYSFQISKYDQAMNSIVQSTHLSQRQPSRVIFSRPY